MAVDTRDKRFSMIGFSQANWTAPDPDGAIDTRQDRYQFLELYRHAQEPEDIPGRGVDFTAYNSRSDFTAPNSRSDFTVGVI